MKHSAVIERRLAGGLTPVAESSYRSARVQSLLRQRWKEVVKQQPPAVRERWLDSAEGRAALGAATCKQLLKAVRSQFQSISGGLASSCWVDAWVHHGEMPPGLAFDSKGRLRMNYADRREHAARLVLSAVGVSEGLEHPAGTEPGAMPIFGPPTPRWTPPQAVELEDMIDRLTADEAMQKWYEWPASPSAYAIQRIEIRRGRERGVKH